MEKHLCSLKQRLCPFCKLIGSLVKHGYLYGYSEDSNARIVRGRRIFCSSRLKKRGCGRTYTLYYPHIIRNSTISARTLSAFMNNLQAGFRREIALKLILKKVSSSSVYRLYRKLKERQGAIRTVLLKLTEPPDCDAKEPLLQTIKHLEKVFPDSISPVSDFQRLFQRSIF